VPEPGETRAIVVDVWPMIRLGLATVLTGIGVRTVAEVEDAATLLAVLRAQPAELVLIGEVGGALPDLLRRLGALERPPLAVAVLGAPGPDELRAVLAAGVDAVLPRSVGPDELGEAVLRVLKDERVVSPNLLPLLFETAASAGDAGDWAERAVGASGSASPLTVGANAAAAVAMARPQAEVGGSLTAKEREVVRLLALGRSTAQIAEALFVSPATVKTHLAHIYAKLGVSGRHEALARAASLGLLT